MLVTGYVWIKEINFKSFNEYLCLFLKILNFLLQNVLIPTWRICDIMVHTLFRLFFWLQRLLIWNTICIKLMPRCCFKLPSRNIFISFTWTLNRGWIKYPLWSWPWFPKSGWILKIHSQRTIRYHQHIIASTDKVNS